MLKSVFFSFPFITYIFQCLYNGSQSVARKKKKIAHQDSSPRPSDAAGFSAGNHSICLQNYLLYLTAGNHSVAHQMIWPSSFCLFMDIKSWPKKPFD